MIKTIFFYILFFFTALAADAQNTKLVASCCETKKEEAGRCTGSAYCSACSNCSRCAHCSSGGSCGVCASYSAPVRYTAPRTSGSGSRKVSSGSGISSKSTVKAFSKTDVYSTPKKEAVSAKVKVIYRSEDMLGVKLENLKLYDGPGTEYEVLEVLEKYAILKVIAVDGEWLQVVVVESRNFGFVNAKHVYKI
ncbi:hypothetical protein [Flavobacterium notoginsengisoli]|uniref:hypothetical protein n=1 Tax=Flavobacterium notoginsengisoli TaxID=1478199 RepID=UPI00362F83D7